MPNRASNSLLPLLPLSLPQGAVDVFLDFICYSGGPLPEELLEKTTVPVSMLWGEKVSWTRMIFTGLRIACMVHNQPHDCIALFWIPPDNQYLLQYHLVDRSLSV